MWDAGDERNYAMETANGTGQIHDDEFSKDIRRYAADPRFETYLEIGTWNGLGSTRAFAEGFFLRDAERCVLYSLECNADKCADAQKLYERDEAIRVLNEVIWNEEPADFYDIFPQCRTDPTARRWHEIDMINMKACPLFLERPGLPEIFDVVLLDGGEFTTYHEFQALKDRCRILMLDDVDSDKCRLIRDHLRSNPDTWTILKTGAIRNGYLIAERKKI